MKILKAIAPLATLLFFAAIASAQTGNLPVNEPDYNKPKLFADLPEKLSLQTGNLEALLELPVGRQISSQLAAGFQLTGVVVSKSAVTDAAVKTIIINSSNRQGATLSFSRITKSDGSITYTGRLLSRTAGDAFVIVKEGTGYILQKKAYYDLLNE